MSSLEIKNLVLGGGYVHGISYIGGLAALEHLGLLSTIKKVAGVSTGGSITALLLALGYTIPELVEKLVQLNFQDSFLEEPIKSSLGNNEENEEQDSLCNCCTKFSKLSTTNQQSELSDHSNSRLFAETTQSIPLNSGLKLMKWLTSTIEKSTLRPNCTFAELHEFVIGKRNVNLLRRRGVVFRDLILFGYNLNANYTTTFSYEASPDVIIADAVRISSCLPYLFTPWQYYIKDNTRAERKIAYGYENVHWIDGGVREAGFPIDYFDSESSPKATTLGFVLTKNVEAKIGNSKDKLNEGDNNDNNHDHEAETGEGLDMAIVKNIKSGKSIISNSWDYNIAILNASGFYKLNQQTLIENSRRVVQIPLGCINPLRLELSNHEKNVLLESGWNCVMEKLYNATTTNTNDGGEGVNQGPEEIPKCPILIKE